MADKKEMELTEEEVKEDILGHEDDYIAGLLAAADNVDEETTTIEIIRNKKKYFAFRVHALTEEELSDIRKKYTRYAKNRRQGIRVPEELDTPKYRASLIFNSTVKEDQEKLWNNTAIKKGLEAKGKSIINALDVIEAVLLPGEKERIMDILDEINGFNNEEIKENTAKN